MKNIEYFGEGAKDFYVCPDCLHEAQYELSGECGIDWEQGEQRGFYSEGFEWECENCGALEYTQFSDERPDGLEAVCSECGGEDELYYRRHAQEFVCRQCMADEAIWIMSFSA